MDQTSIADQIPPHQQRVINERSELFDKVEKLQVFTNGNVVFNSLPDDEQKRMVNQYYAMSLYLDILDQRISAFR